MTPSRRAAFILLLAAWLPWAWAAEPLKLTVGNDYAPYTGSQLPGGGIATEVVKAAFSQVGVDTVMTWVPWARGYADVKKGLFAATFPYVRSEERERDMLLSEAIAMLRMRVFVKAGASKYDFSRADGYLGSTLCLASGATAHPKLLPLLETGKLKRVAPLNVSICIDLIHAGLADFFVLEERVGRAALAASALPQGAVVVADVAPLSESELFLLAPREAAGSKALIEQFNQGLAALRKRGGYDEILQRHAK